MTSNNNIPQGYKQTDLGIIPEDWEVKIFSQVFDIFPNNTYPRDYMNNHCGIVKNIHYGDVLIKYPTLLNVNNCKIPYLDTTIKTKSYKLVQSGDVIIADTAEDDTVGKCVEVVNVDNEKILAGLHTFFCSPKLPFASGWLGFYINSFNYHNQLIPYITGIKVSSISKSSIQETKLIIPPLAEQKAIATALSDVDALIAALEKKIAKKKLIKQGAMQQLLTGKKRLQGFTEEWVEKKLEDICDIIMGQSPSSIYYNIQNVGLPLIQGNADLENRQQIVRYYTSQITKVCEEGDVILSVRAPVGAVGKAIHKSCLGRGVCAIKINNDYIYHYLIYIEDDWNSFSKGSTFDSINSDELNKFSLSLPITVKEQQAIATILSDMDKEISDLEAKRDKYRLIKQGMMQKLLTGQIRLK